MNIKYSVKHFLSAFEIAPAKHRASRWKLFHVVTIMVLMLVNAPAISTWADINDLSPAQAASTLTFTAEADASVEERNPGTNNGSAAELAVINANNRSLESYIRVTASGISGPIQSARLRVYSTENTRDGPRVFATGSSWAETGITWNNRPARTGSAADNTGSISSSAWVEYDVTSRVTGNGTYSFVLVGDSNDDIIFSSREGNNAPQLVITFTPASNTSTPTRNPTRTLTVTQASAATPTRTPTPAPGITPTRTPTTAATTGLGSALTFPANADARANEASPSTNYGNETSFLVDGGSGTRQNAYIRFTTSGISGSIQSVKLRIYCTTNGTVNGPAVYLANSTWTESGSGGITWNTQPALLSGAVDNKTSIGSNSWVEYDVTSLVTGNGTFTLALVADGSDGVVFSSREGANPPQLVVTVGTGGPPSTPTPAAAVASRTPTIAATSSGSVTLVGAGDISSCSNNNDEATAKLLDTIPGTVFTAGDNAYIDGSTSDYNNCYDPTWGRHKARTKPVPGNHEYHTSGASGYFQYFNNVASYYAYNLGSWRIYALNSEISVSATSPQVTWLQDDLAANPTQCVLAYWHQPRWSSGSNHGSSSSMQTIWQVLYNAGAEVVISGHEHNYERFSEMNASGAAVSQGLREFVVGTGGAGLYPFSTVLSTSQVRNNSTYGVLKLTLNATGYSWQFVPIAGSTFTDSGSDTCR